MCEPITAAIAGIGSFFGSAGGAMATGLALGAIGTGLSAYSSYQNQEAANDAADYQTKIAQYNAGIAENQAQDAEHRGEIEEKQHRLRVSQFKGSQRAKAAGSGVMVDLGSTMDVLDDTDYFAEQDAMTIRENAAREAYGYRAQAQNYTMEGKLAQKTKRSPWMAAGTSLLGGASPLMRDYAAYKYQTANSRPKSMGWGMFE